MPDNADHKTISTEPVDTPAHPGVPVQYSVNNIRNTVAPGMRIAAAWSWRIIVVLAATALVVYIIGFMSELTIPIAIALLLSALLTPLKNFLIRKGLGASIAAIVVFVCGLAAGIGLVTLVVRQFISGAKDLSDQVSGGLGKVQDWLVTGPLKISQDQIDSATTSIKNSVVENKDSLTSGALNTATSAGHLITGFVLVLFILFFFLRDGSVIWHWLVGITPAQSRVRLRGAGERAWATLTGYVRATVLVAFVDAVGIGLGLVIVGVPLAVPLTAFVFLSSFIPIIGALLSGIVAVLVALVALGPVQAVIILAVVVAVQQLEGHVLQPILLGRAVSLHPLGVALSIAAGVIAYGITGALLAVPLVACMNAAIKFLAGESRAMSTASTASASSISTVSQPTPAP
ncbi:AI-2E family transporter [Nakamurella antarctica]|nr:AI-2E family transporter [Nakamurella antarctica]